jgi:ABC-2 type transport system permease protein
LRTARTIAAKELRQRIRDRSAIFTAIVAPLVLAVIITAGLGNTTNFHATFAVVDLDKGPIAQAFTTQVLQAPQLRKTLTPLVVPTEAAARAAVRRGDVDAGFILPADLSARTQAGNSSTINVIASPARDLAAQVARSIADGFAHRVSGVALAARTALATGRSLPGGSITPVIDQVTAAAPPATVDDVALRDKFKPGAFFGPSMAIFFLFFTASAGIRSLHGERQTGTLARLLSAPTPRWAILGGKMTATFLTSVVALGTLVVASQILLGVRWGNPIAVIALSLATILAIMGIASIVATLARTEEQANSYSSMLGLILALLGGNFIPGAAPTLLRRVALITPNGWALRGFTDLGSGGSFATISSSLLVLLLIALVTGSFAMARARRLVLA